MKSDKVKDSFIKVLLMKMYENNFAEPQLQNRANNRSINIMTNCQRMTRDF